MKIEKRDQRALWLLGVAVAAVAIFQFAVSEGPEVRVVAPVDSIAVAEKRLAKLRQRAAAQPGAEKLLKEASATLAEREKGIIRVATAAQAQAQLIQILRRVASAQTPPIELKATEMGGIQGLGKHYGEVSVPAVFECRIEQLLNLLADLNAQPEALATNELRISVADPKQKSVNVRLTVSAVTAGSLVPKRKGGSL